LPFSQSQFLSLADVLPPLLQCGMQQNFTLPRYESKMIVSWQLPTAFDNSGEAIKVKSIAGLQSPAYLSAGLNKIKYIGTDSSGNNATCDLLVSVIGKWRFYM